MLIQISREEYSKEFIKKAWYQTNIIVWTIVFLYLTLSIPDFIFLNDVWLQILIVRIISIIFIYALYSYFQHRRQDYRLLLHLTLLLPSATSALLCNLVNIQHLTAYYLIYSIVILFFNLQVFWEPVNSVIQALLSLVLLAIFFNTLSQYNAELVVNSGGQYFFIVLLMSCLIPGARYKVIQREINSQLTIEQSNEQLKSQNRDIAQKNALIDEQYEKLRKLDEQKNSFINMAGHDLKNLIGSIVMSNNLIRDEEQRLSEDQVEYVNYIAQSADKMQYMLNKLMVTKEIETSEIKFNLQIFDINAETKMIFKGLEETARMKNIFLIDNVLKLPINVRLDKVFTGQVFQNLLSNAIKFSQTNNNIRVVTSLQRQKFVFEIIDEGIAIGQEELKMMFNKLKTLNDTGSGDMIESRLGLGLSIAKLMTQEMGGELSYRSDDNGNYFRVEFYAIN